MEDIKIYSNETFRNEKYIICHENFTGWGCQQIKYFSGEKEVNWKTQK